MHNLPSSVSINHSPSAGNEYLHFSLGGLWCLNTAVEEFAPISHLHRVRTTTLNRRDTNNIRGILFGFLDKFVFFLWEWSDDSISNHQLIVRLLFTRVFESESHGAEALCAVPICHPWCLPRLKWGLHMSKVVWGDSITRTLAGVQHYATFTATINCSQWTRRNASRKCRKAGWPSGYKTLTKDQTLRRWKATPNRDIIPFTYFEITFSSNGTSERNLMEHFVNQYNEWKCLLDVIASASFFVWLSSSECSLSPWKQIQWQQQGT